MQGKSPSKQIGKEFPGAVLAVFMLFRGLAFWQEGKVTREETEFEKTDIDKNRGKTEWERAFLADLGTRGVLHSAGGGSGGVRRTSGWHARGTAGYG